MWRDSYGVHESWGTSSAPEIAAAQLQLDQLLEPVPENGLVVDIGAGIGLSLAAAVHIRRPRLTKINVDPGFSLLTPQQLLYGLEKTLEDYGPEQQAFLKSSGVWFKYWVAGVSEALPLRDEAADLVVSYAATPEYTDARLSLDESLRILKLGGCAGRGISHFAPSPASRTWATKQGFLGLPR